MEIPDKIRFIADINVGKLARLLRMMGYDTLIFKGKDDGDMVIAALAEGRIILTRDSHIMERRLIKKGQVRSILIKSDDAGEQLQQVIGTLGLKLSPQPFAICIECNEPLVEKRKEEVLDCVPDYVYHTHNDYMECPLCHRIYWKGTHWQAMTRRLEKLEKGQSRR